MRIQFFIKQKKKARFKRAFLKYFLCKFLIIKNLENLPPLAKY